MAEYKTIKGFKTQSYATDPVASQFAGGTWASGTSLTVGIAQSKTTGGVLASVLYNSEIIILEKGAHDVTFAGKRISKNYLASGEVMDQNFGTAKEKITKGMCDLVLERSQLKPTICTLAKIIKKKENLAVTNKIQDDSSYNTSREILQKTAEKI